MAVQKTGAQKISQKKRQEILKKIENVLSVHDKFSRSYLWTGDNGNGSVRDSYCRYWYTYETFKYNGHKYVFDMDLDQSRKNTYYKGYFMEDDIRKDARLFKKIKKELDAAIKAYNDKHGIRSDD